MAYNNVRIKKLNINQKLKSDRSGRLSKTFNKSRLHVFVKGTVLTVVRATVLRAKQERKVVRTKKHVRKERREYRLVIYINIVLIYIKKTYREFYENKRNIFVT